LSDICKSEAERVLLVEGKDDCHVVLALAQYYQLPENFGIFECGSDEKVLKRLNALIPKSDPGKPQAVGVVLDATEGRWGQFTAKIAHHRYEIPAQPDPNGTIIEGDDTKPRIGVWIMPDNSNLGMLEDFLLSGAPVATIEVATEAVDLAKRRQVTTFKDVHYSKAVIHTYLAWQDEPGRPLGQSVTNKMLSPETPEARRFVAWLRKLFPDSFGI
jgi:hypothetical protein